jgi:glycosidase
MQGTTVGTSCCDVTGLNKRNWLAEGYRFPMQWSSECYAGFSAEIAYYPPHPSYLHNNVTAELADPDSLLNHYAALIRLRNENPALRVGELLPVDTSTPALFSILRFRPGSGEAILVLVNLGDEPIFDYGYSLRLNQPGAPTGTYEPELLMGDASFEIPDLTVSEVGFQDYQPLFHIGAFETLIIRLIRK